MRALVPSIMLLLVALSGCQALDAATAPGGSGSASGTAGCLEESTPLTGDQPTKLGVTTAELLALAAGEHSSPLRWNHAASSRLLLTVGPRAAAYVHSRFDPQGELAPNLRTPTQQCSDYVRITASVDVQSADGRLAELIERVDLIAYSPYELRATLQIDADALAGGYEPLAGSQHCFVALRIKVLIERTGSSGSITELFGATTCERPAGALTPFASGGWGGRWQNY